MDKQNVTKRISRRFLGKTEFVIDRSTPQAELISKRHRHFWQRMLRAYHKGQETFVFHGQVYDPQAKAVPYNPISMDATPRYYVLQKYYEV
jgi:hypothetical protein